jgi:hypothetical protein
VKARTVTAYYETDSGEQTIEVLVSPDGLRHCTIETELSDVPADEVKSIEQQARDKFWAAEREEYERAESHAEYWRELRHDETSQASE